MIVDFAECKFNDVDKSNKLLLIRDELNTEAAKKEAPPPDVKTTAEYLALAGENAKLNDCVLDKNCVINDGRNLSGYLTHPFYVKRKSVI